VYACLYSSKHYPHTYIQSLSRTDYASPVAIAQAKNGTHSSTMEAHSRNSISLRPCATSLMSSM